jgi:hypothetical protein
MIQIARLTDEITTAGLPVVGVAVASQKQSETPCCTWHDRPDGYVRLDWSAIPTIDQKSKANTIVINHDGGLNTEEKMLLPGINQAALAALIILSHSKNSSIPPVYRKVIQDMIDKMGDVVIEKLGLQKL